jgi:hypothetical protein
MKYEIDFHNPACGQTKTIIGVLDAHEVHSSELHRQAFALRHAYQQVPAGFLHVGAVRLERVN